MCFLYCFIDVNDSFSFVNEQDWAAALGRIQLPGEYISPYVLLFLYSMSKGSYAGSELDVSV